ncbi:MAG: UvrD-helicase domain-containing protein, partial [Desulfobacterales bacterium]
NINARSKRSLVDKIVKPLETYLSTFNESSLDLVVLLELIDRIQAVTSSGRQGIACLVPDKWTQKGNNIQICPNLEAIAVQLETLVEGLVPLINYLAIDAIKQLQTDAVRVKQENGWISYDDMLSQVASALNRDSRSGLIQTLRHKYKIAFVDEFQDTDPVQWRIFKRLFLDKYSDASDNLLFLIGDPKQAIYSFRGADVYAYLEARNEMEGLAKIDRANLYSLATNWRSKPDLVSVFNDLFCRTEWFPAHDRTGPLEIGYQDAGSPPEKDLPAILVADDSRRPVFNVVDLSAATSPRQAKPALARYIAREVRYLIDRGNIEIQSKDEPPRPLDFGDICLLVRGKAEASLLEPELANHAIPYAFYKKPGLFLSEEALYLSLMFHAVSDPGNTPDVKKALLTPFFTYQPNDLTTYETIPMSHPLKQLLFDWNDLARSRKWGMLFQSLMEDSGFLFREAQSRDWDRKHTNYRQIFEHLEGAAYRKNLDFRGLSALLDSYRKQTIGVGDDADIHQIETEEKKVQIMTMHVSKGLQFPVVFVAGGLTQPFADDYHVYHDYDPAKPDAGVRKVIDISRTYNREQHDREKYDEDKRLYYVALTRAQFKLYVPFFPTEKKYAWLGPVCRFLSDAIAAALPRDAVHPVAGWLDAEKGAVPVAYHGEEKGWEAVSERPVTAHPPLLPANRNYQSRMIVLESFSSLQGRLQPGREPAMAETGFQVTREKDKEDDEPPAGFDSEAIRSLRSDDEIAGGADIGSMFHDILEHIDFQAVTPNPDDLLNNTETENIITKTMEAYRVEGRWRQQICRIIANTLTTPVYAAEASFSLKELNKEDRIHEVEFNFPFDLPVDKPLKIPDCDIVKARRCFIRGYVDLIFRYKETFFIADWKSNRLDDGYGRKALDACMNAVGYHLQYKLYTVALLRWLKQVFGNRFNPDTQFGGVFYFFLRGMGTGDGNGVFYVAPTEVGALEDLESELAARISRN